MLWVVYSSYFLCRGFPSLYLKKYFIYLFERGRESTSRGSRRQREREKQVPHWAGSPMQGSNLRPWDHDLSQRHTLNILSYPVLKKSRVWYWNVAFSILTWQGRYHDHEMLHFPRSCFPLHILIVKGNGRNWWEGLVRAVRRNGNDSETLVLWQLSGLIFGGGNIRIVQISDSFLPF